MEWIAHTKNDRGVRQGLEEHLRAVAELAAQFGKPFGSSELAYLVGLVHDMGKYAEPFQTYLRTVEAGLPAQTCDHKGAGALYLEEMRLGPLAFLVQGHHGGLQSREKLNDWLHERRQDPTVKTALAQGHQAFPELQHLSATKVPNFVKSQTQAELFLRMLFSALVDADFLDTERHFHARQADRRQGSWKMSELYERFLTQYSQDFQNVSSNIVNKCRARAYQACQKAADLPPGIFRLTLPTGGGKTLSSLGFGLRHAHIHRKQRIIYALPYMSITEQIAQEFRHFFPETGIVLEHHSGVQFREKNNGCTEQELWRRLSSENWDAPLIVTTTVQFCESLFARSTSACRKLHNIANSVVILDEVQMLPPGMLTPILDVLQQLVSHYKVTVVLCTATQPALQRRADFEGLQQIVDILPDAETYFETLKRVTYHIRPTPLTWEEVAAAMQKEQQVLTIVNTKADALALLEALDPAHDEAVFHLSTLLCGAHRRRLLSTIRQRLKDGQNCRVVSTQLIEAGVDVDFACVWRAIGPLDRLVQAAGRCNREGKLDTGHVTIFQPAEGNFFPQGSYTIGTEITWPLLQEFDLQLHSPQLFQRYFRDLYASVNNDAHHIQDLRKNLKYEEVASTFRIIEDKTVTVVVEYNHPEDIGHIRDLIRTLQADPAQASFLLRQLQPYTVMLSFHQFAEARNRHAVRPLFPLEPASTESPAATIWQWCAPYDDKRGIVLDGLPMPEYFMS